MLYLSEGQIEQDLDNYSESIEFEHKNLTSRDTFMYNISHIVWRGGGGGESTHLLA